MNGLGLRVRCIHGVENAPQPNFESPMMAKMYCLDDKPQQFQSKMVLKFLKPKEFSRDHQDPPNIELVAREEASVRFSRMMRKALKMKTT